MVNRSLQHFTKPRFGHRRISNLVLACGMLLHLVQLAQKDALAQSGRPHIEKLGTIDLDIVETQPIVFGKKLHRFESVRTRYKDNVLGKPYFRFVDVATGQATPPFAQDHDLGSALVVDETMYVLGTPGWGASAIDLFWSKDLKNWESKRVLELAGWELFNTSVCRSDGRYVMAFEVGKGPPGVVGTPYTNRFAESQDMLKWSVIPEPAVFTKDRYSACPTLRWLDGWFYLIYLEAEANGNYNPYLVRSRNLSDWQLSPFNPILHFDDSDKRIANSRLVAAQSEKISHAVNVNNSDVDLCEFDGRVVINYSWGDQHGKEFLAEAVYKGTLAQFLMGFFPNNGGERP